MATTTTPAPPLALVCFYSDGAVFPVQISIPTLERANSARAWQRIGQGQFEDWRIISMTELRELLHAGRVSLSCFTEEAQAEKRAEIEAAKP